MASSIIARNIKQLEKSLQKNIDYLDLDYRGVDRDVLDVELTKGSVVLNAYKMWLQSRSTSYIREAGTGGFLTEDIHHYPFEAASEPIIENDLRSMTAEQWPDIELLECEVKCMAPQKYWKVRVAVRDKITDLIAYDMYLTDNSIVTPS